MQQRITEIDDHFVTPTDTATTTAIATGSVATFREVGEGVFRWTANMIAFIVIAKIGGQTMNGSRRRRVSASSLTKVVQFAIIDNGVAINTPISSHFIADERLQRI